MCIFFMGAPLKPVKYGRMGIQMGELLDKRFIKKFQNRAETLTSCVLVFCFCPYKKLFNRVILVWINV